ncbi:MAG: hypothetical protein HY320_10845 [Armatimonadetes bacterium]|nr:hypothetical protein [Armatimonadota bacterium]
MKTRLLWMPACLVVCAAACAAAPPAAEAQGYAPEELFSLEVGQADQQLGIWVSPNPEKPEGPAEGPIDLAIGADGSVYIADRMNHCVKRFDQQGNFIMRTQGDLENINYIAVDRDTGSVYALGGAGANILCKFAADGGLLWQLDLREEGGQLWGGGGALSTGPGGVICIEQRGDTIGRLAVLDAEGHFLGVREGRACTPTGRVLSFAPVPGEKLSVQVYVSDFQGRALGAYQTLPVPARFSLFQGVEGRPSYESLDDADYLYLRALGTSPYRVQLSPGPAGLTIASDIIVTRYDPSGRPVAHMRFPGSPYHFGDPVTVDGAGNIYHLTYEENRVHVIRYRLGGGAEGLQVIREMPTMAARGRVYVPLRLVAEHQGMKLRWSPKSRQVSVSAGKAGRGVPLGRFRVGDAGVRLHYGRVWVSSAVCRELGIALKTDKKRQVAYLQRFAGRRVVLTPR